MTTNRQPIDWRKLSLINADKIINENDVESLQSLLEFVTFADVNQITDIDPCVATLLKLSQRMTQYTLGTQEQLKLSLENCVNENTILKARIQELENSSKTNEENVKKLKIDNRKRRKIIEDLQKRIDLGANSYYACPFCDKIFLNATYLQAHIARKHPEKASYFGDAIAHAQKMVNDVNKNLAEEKKEIAEKQNQIEEKMRIEEQIRQRELEAAKQAMALESEGKNLQLQLKVQELTKLLEAEKRDANERDLIHNDQLGNLKKTILDLQNGLLDVNKKVENRPTEIIREVPVMAPVATNNPIIEPKPQLRAISPVFNKLPQESNRSSVESARLMQQQPEVVPEVKEKSPERITLQQPVAQPRQILKEQITRPNIVNHQPVQPQQQQQQLPQQPTLTPLNKQQIRNNNINELDRRLRDLNANLSLEVTRVSNQDLLNYMQKLRFERETAKRAVFPNFFTTRQLCENKLVNEANLRAPQQISGAGNKRNHSGMSTTSSGFGSPSNNNRIKSLSSQTLPETYSSILKKPSNHSQRSVNSAVSFAQKPPNPINFNSKTPSQSKLPSSMPNLSESNKSLSYEESVKLDVSGTANLSQTNQSEDPYPDDYDSGNSEDSDDEITQSENEAAEEPKNVNLNRSLSAHSEYSETVTNKTETANDDDDDETTENTSTNRVHTENDDDDESSEDDEDNTEAFENSHSKVSFNEPNKSQSRGDAGLGKNRKLNGKNNLDEEDEESSDDWMDELDTALKTQGYNGPN